MVPTPPDFQQITPLFHTWKQSEPVVRIYDSAYLPNEFHPGRAGAGVRGRFHFFADADGIIVPVLYGSNLAEGAISETIFHDVPIRGTVRTVQESRLEQAAIVTLTPRRDLKLVELFGYGLRRLQIQPAELTSTEPTEYPRTVLWAEALHRSFPQVDGLVWMSKQFNAAKALVLFGTRVQQADLSVASAPMSLRVGPGRTLVDQAANNAGIIIIG